MYTYTCMFVHVYMCLCVCIYIYIYICVLDCDVPLIIRMLSRNRVCSLGFGLVALLCAMFYSLMVKTPHVGSESLCVSVFRSAILGGTCSPLLPNV